MERYWAEIDDWYVSRCISSVNIAPLGFGVRKSGSKTTSWWVQYSCVQGEFVQGKFYLPETKDFTSWTFFTKYFFFQFAFIPSNVFKEATLLSGQITRHNSLGKHSQIAIVKNSQGEFQNFSYDTKLLEISQFGSTTRNTNRAKLFSLRAMGKSTEWVKRDEKSLCPPPTCTFITLVLDVQVDWGMHVQCINITSSAPSMVQSAQSRILRVKSQLLVPIWAAEPDRTQAHIHKHANTVIRYLSSRASAFTKVRKLFRKIQWCHENLLLRTLGLDSRPNNGIIYWLTPSPGQAVVNNSRPCDTDNFHQMTDQ